MSEKEVSYKVIARKYRPQTFKEVLGQDPIVTTLKNSIKSGRLAHAYLFSGPRGTGKTTLARILAKAINCETKTEDFEPCNNCASCREITSGSSMDVLEIDGASHRGIDDIREINETVSFAASSGRYKIYIIDEVHMLTKEAFNALLKTLEEPPPSVKFFFATTEPHKVLPTILSRCQHFNLKRVETSLITRKLAHIAKDLTRIVDEGSLALVAKKAEGGLRDAESIFDQLLSLVEGNVTEEKTAKALGLVQNDLFNELDKAIEERNFSFAFKLSSLIFDEGKDLASFLTDLTAHFRELLLKNLSNKAPSFYSKEQLLNILEECLNAETAIKTTTVPKIYLEAHLLKLIRSRQKQPLEELMKRLLELETRLSSTASLPVEQKILPLEPQAEIVISSEPIIEPVNEPSSSSSSSSSPEPAIVTSSSSSSSSSAAPSLPVSRVDTLLQFAAQHLEGKIIKK